MTRTVTASWLMSCCVLIAAGDRSDVSSPWDAGQRDEFTQNARTRWEAYRSEVTTAEIEYLRLYFRCDELPLSGDQFCDALAEMDLSIDDETAQRILNRFCPALLTGDTEEVSQRLTAVSEWRTLLMRESEMRSTGSLHEHVVSGELHLFSDLKNEDVKGYRRGRCPYWFEGPSWFRLIPENALLDPPSELTNAGAFVRVDDTTAPDKKACTTTLDRDDALPRRWDLIYPESGTLTRIELCDQYMTYPGNIRYPSLRVRADLEGEQVKYVLLTLIRSARFNQHIDEERFRMSAPAHWGYFDYRPEVRSAGVWPVPIQNVTAFFLGQHAAVSPAAAPERGPVVLSWRAILLITNGAILIAIGLFLWRKSM